MQCALDTKKALSSPISTKKVSLEGSVSVVRLIELDMQDIRVVDDSLQWPKTVNGYIVPPIDGALLLYDVVDPSSLDPVPDILSESWLCNTMVRNVCEMYLQSRS